MQKKMELRLSWKKEKKKEIKQSRSEIEVFMQKEKKLKCGRSRERIRGIMSKLLKYIWITNEQMSKWANEQMLVFKNKKGV